MPLFELILELLGATGEAEVLAGTAGELAAGAVEGAGAVADVSEIAQGLGGGELGGVGELVGGTGLADALTGGQQALPDIGLQSSNIQQGPGFLSGGRGRGLETGGIQSTFPDPSTLGPTPGQATNLGLPTEPGSFGGPPGQTSPFAPGGPNVAFPGQTPAGGAPIEKLSAFSTDLDLSGGGGGQPELSSRGRFSPGNLIGQFIEMFGGEGNFSRGLQGFDSQAIEPGFLDQLLNQTGQQLGDLFESPSGGSQATSPLPPGPGPIPGPGPPPAGGGRPLTQTGPLRGTRGGAENSALASLSQRELVLILEQLIGGRA